VRGNPFEEEKKEEQPEDINASAVSGQVNPVPPNMPAAPFGMAGDQPPSINTASSMDQPQSFDP